MSNEGALRELVQLLRLERLEVNLFRGLSRDIGSKQVFGGQVLGQALAAAAYTVEGRAAHSLHAYFLRRGDMNAPIIYEVDHQRDGRSFSSRRVVAIQHGHPILNLAASFQVPEKGLEHQLPMPDVPMPEELTKISNNPDVDIKKVPEKMRRFLDRDRPFEVRPIRGHQDVDGSRKPMMQSWFRTVDKISDEPHLHQAILAYASDYGLVTSALIPHRIKGHEENLQVVSLDHAMWFHHPCRVDEWLLYSTQSPISANTRGLARGAIYRQDGTLVASTAQEGLMRLWPTEK